MKKLEQKRDEMAEKYTGGIRYEGCIPERADKYFGYW